MSFETPTSDAAGGPLARIGFPQLLATTLVAVTATILLGVAAKATGSGLACNANWPLCDGGVLNLFPATFPSFFEWIHRVVAGTAGLLMIATAAVAIRGAVDDRRVVAAVTLGLVLTPFQVYLGAETVLSYELAIQQAHFWLALCIFTCFVIASVLVWGGRLSRGHVSVALVVAAAAVPLHVALSPLFIGRYTPVVQTIQYGVILAMLAGVVLAAIAGRRRLENRRRAGFLTVLPLGAFVLLVLGRRTVMTFAPVLDLLYVLVAVALFVSLLAGAVLTRRARATARAPGA